MDLTSSKYLESPPTLFPSKMEAATIESNKNPFLDSFSDPFCKETSDFVRGLCEITPQNGVPRRNISMEAPMTPGRPIFSFSSSTNYSRRKCFPSKWDDAEKWLVGGSSCNDYSPAGNNNNNNNKTSESSKVYSKQCSGYKPPQVGEFFAEKSRITTEEKVSKVISTGFNQDGGVDDGAALCASTNLLAKDKFPNELDSDGHSGPMQEKFVFGNSSSRKTISKHRDVGTEMTPLASSTTSRCPTPFESTSPARHNTPADRSGPLGPNDDEHSKSGLSLLKGSHLAKLHCGAQFDSAKSNWWSREEEEDDVSKSLRHFEATSGGECRISESEPKNFVWEEEENNKICLRYQREEAKIQAWVNLQSAKAEAESRKLEVKIQKMRANMEEKLMKRMADVHRKAEEWRANARFQHSEQIRKASQQAREQAINKKGNNNNNLHLSGLKSCGFFPCHK
ncbi:Remorin family protein [Striga hermonthica]|uniref:Remorin family protein n=1 Tax=Striga hermonthica TaxID=68872 RepID=A0A9N7N9H2_STRHE|nr:Remorin family protein [Striga hermonthica]